MLRWFESVSICSPTLLGFQQHYIKLLSNDLLIILPKKFAQLLVILFPIQHNIIFLKFCFLSILWLTDSFYLILDYFSFLIHPKLYFYTPNRTKDYYYKYVCKLNYISNILFVQVLSTWKIYLGKKGFNPSMLINILMQQLGCDFENVARITNLLYGLPLEYLRPRHSCNFGHC